MPYQAVMPTYGMPQPMLGMQQPGLMQPVMQPAMGMGYGQPNVGLMSPPAMVVGNV